ncbi:hypothetical protein MMC25_008245 [Agyrium rufum]|nr:hypothetical protein [Agyrium rufum]
MPDSSFSDETDAYYEYKKGYAGLLKKAAEAKIAKDAAKESQPAPRSQSVGSDEIAKETAKLKISSTKRRNLKERKKADLPPPKKLSLEEVQAVFEVAMATPVVAKKASKGKETEKIGWA